MSRTALVTGFTIVLVVLAAVPTAYGLRWSYCKHYGTKSGAFSMTMPLLGWQQAAKAEQEKLEKWSKLIASRYSPECDSWNELSAVMRSQTLLRVWCETPDRLSEFYVYDSTPGSYSHSVGIHIDQAYYHASAISKDGNWEVEQICQTQTSLRFTKLENTEESESPDFFNELDHAKICFEAGGEFRWESEYKFAGFTYDFDIQLPDRNDALHRHNTNAYDFITAGLRSLDRLEAAVVEYLNSDGPKLISTKLVDQVDIIKCTCEKIDGPANRPLTKDEKSMVMADMMAELEHRRTLLKTHGDVWFETLQKIRIEVE
jgi:hypothetical protein